MENPKNHALLSYNECMHPYPKTIRSFILSNMKTHDVSYNK